MTKITEDSPIWEIIQYEFNNLGKESVVKKEFSERILEKYPHIKKGTLSAQISIQVINKRSRTNYNQCGKERICGDNKFDFLFEQEDKTLCKYDKSKHGTWEIYKRDDGKLDVRIISNDSIDHTKAEGDKAVEKEEKLYYTDVPKEKVLLDQIIAEENNDEVILNLVRYFENNKMTDKEVFLLTAQILEINKDAQVAAEIARLLINAGQNKSFAFSLLLDKKDYTGDDWSFNAFDEIKAELIAENNMLAVGDDIVDNLDSEVVEDVSKEITIEMMVEEYTGKGTYTSSEGAIYVGEWKDGNMHGKGTLTLPTGDKIEGVWKNGRQNGQGILTYSSGDIYVGEFKDDIKNGQGKMTYSSGNKYVGEHKDGKIEGQGTFTWTNGNKYVGEFKDGKIEGKGTYIWPDGTIYVGEFKDDHKHGQGKMTYADGSEEKGLFENGKYIGEDSREDIVEKKKVKDMKHPNYNDWSDEIKTHYDKIKNKIKKHGHVIQGTVDGKDALERPFAYTIGASFKTGAELLCFFPIKGEGLSVITGIINRILDAVKKGDLSLDSQILNDNHIYYLPIAMLVLEEEIKQDTESVWPRQLERDGFLAEFSTNDHKLILLICTDKNGNFPWDEKCESYWPQLCPPPLVAMAQEQLTGDDSLLCRLEGA